MKKILIYAVCFLISMKGEVEAVLAGGRPNAISGGQNAFAGVVNPANAVWIKDRFDIGVFLVYQNFYLKNCDNIPLFPAGKFDLTHRVKNLFTADAAVHKQITLGSYESSLSLAGYTTPAYLKIQSKQPIVIAGTTPILVDDKTQVISGIFSLKLNSYHSVGIALDYFYLSHLRNGFQRSDNPLRSVSPGHVTNNGKDHSGGFGFSLGWRWNISQNLTFGAAYVKKSYVGKFWKYRGYEPYHAKNYIPATIGAGFTYQFNQKLAGRLEVLWTNLGSLPNSNNNILPNGKLNTNKRGSDKSPGAGLQDATFINFGLGCSINPKLSLGGGYSHRIKLRRTSNFLSHTYTLQTIYNFLSVGANFNYRKNDLFFTFTHGFKNRVSGYMPIEIGGGKFTAKKNYESISLAWGYLY